MSSFDDTISCICTVFFIIVCSIIHISAAILCMLLNQYLSTQVVYSPGLCIDTAGVQFIELDPRKPSEDDKKVMNCDHHGKTSGMNGPLLFIYLLFNL